MKRTLIILIISILLITSYQAYAAAKWWDKGVDLFKSQSAEKVSSELSIGDIGSAFKQALRIGSEKVTHQLGSADGFNADPAIHIPLPGSLQTVKNMLTKVGMSSVVDDLELKLNRAAEAATPKAKDLFVQAITDMTFEDVKGIYNGPNDSATQYFRQNMSPKLIAEMRPIIDESLSQVGAIRSYDTMMSKYSALPFVPDVKANLSDHVVQKGIDGIFHYLAKEEAAIRENPMKQTTDLLKKVFGKK